MTSNDPRYHVTVDDRNPSKIDHVVQCQMTSYSDFMQCQIGYTTGQSTTSVCYIKNYKSHSKINFRKFQILGITVPRSIQNSQNVRG